MNTLYLSLVWLLMVSSSVVRFEPAPYDVFVVLLFVIGVALSLVRYPRYLLAPILFLAAFLLNNLVSLLFAADIARGFFYFTITFYLIVSWLFFVGLVAQFGKRGLNAVWSGYTVAAVIPALVGSLSVFGYVLGSDWFVWGEGRAVALFKDPNVFGAFLVPAALYAIRQSELSVKAGRFLWVSIVALLSVGILLSLSRGAWANYFVATVLYLLLPGIGQLKKRAWGTTAIVLAAFSLLVYLAEGTEISVLVGDRFAWQSYDEDRFLTQAKAWQAGLMNPLGIGPGQSEIVFEYATHNLYLRILAEYGWVGCIAFLGFLSLTLLRAIRTASMKTYQYGGEAALVAAVLGGALFSSLFIDSLHWRHLWVLLALPWAIPGRLPQRAEWWNGENILHYHSR